MDEIGSIVGTNLRQLRKERGLSLDRLAEASGVSKSMLGQIERGETNPTVGILWRIATAMKVSFSALVRKPKPVAEVFDIESFPPLLQEGSERVLRLLLPFDGERRFEVYEMRLAPGTTHISDPHQEGVEEFVVVLRGTLAVSLDEESFVVRREGCIRFAAHLPHAYRNEGDDEVAFLDIISYPQA